MKKISFTGDVLCSDVHDKICRTETSYDYTSLFSSVSDFLGKSDFVVVNLETTLSGAERGYTNAPASFNTPNKFASALKTAGIKFVTLANNHILDRGLDGMFHTIDVLKNAGIEYTGAYVSEDDSNKIRIRRFGDTTVAFIAFTYGTNSEHHHFLLNGENDRLVDILRRQPDRVEYEYARRSLPLRAIRRVLHKILKIRVFHDAAGTLDTASPKDVRAPENSEYEARMKEKIARARERADVVVACLHVGGQYNDRLGTYTKYLLGLASETGVDLIVANHPHCILPQFYLNGVHTFSALGDFSFTPGKWFVDGKYADYSIVLHVYVSDGRIVKKTFSILKTLTREDGFTYPVPLYDFYCNPQNALMREGLDRDCRRVLKRFGFKASAPLIREEYEL